MGTEGEPGVVHLAIQEVFASIEAVSTPGPSLEIAELIQKCTIGYFMHLAAPNQLSGDLQRNPQGPSCAEWFIFGSSQNPRACETGNISRSQLQRQHHHLRRPAS